MVKTYSGLKNPTLFVLFIGLIFLSLVGTDVVRDKLLYKKIGFFEVHPYKYGLYITYPNSGVFYNVSPFDMYAVNEQGIKRKLIEHKADLVAKEIEPKNKIAEIIDSLKTYFEISNVDATFIDQDKQLKIETHRNGSMAEFYMSSQSLVTLEASEKIIMTLSYSDEDIITDKGSYFLLTNPEFNSAIKINKQSDTYSNVTINNVDKVIEFSLKENNYPKIQLETLESWNN